MLFTVQKQNSAVLPGISWQHLCHVIYYANS